MGNRNSMPTDPGQRFNESAKETSEKKEVLSEKRLGLTEESRVAAEAALARLQKTKKLAFNNAKAYVLVEAKKELEEERVSKPSGWSHGQMLNESQVASSAIGDASKNKGLCLSEENKTSAQVPSLRVQENHPKGEATKESEAERVTMTAMETEEKNQTKTDLPKTFAAAGVYFKCPVINNEVLTRDEWKENIKKFLYEQFQQEWWLAASLIIQSCNNNKEEIDSCVETLCKYLENIVNNPDDEKYQKIRMSNRTFCKRVRPIEGAMELLLAAGFSKEILLNPEGFEEDYMVFTRENIPDVKILSSIIDALLTAEPIQLQLDRNVQVLLPSQATSDIHLPASFFKVTAAELHREQRLRIEAAEKNQMLRTEAMRQSDELRHSRQYQYALIRVWFPDDIVLQGTFSVSEHFNEIHEFVEENIQHTDLPFVLRTPTGQKLTKEDHGNLTLNELNLVPATVLRFAWPSSNRRLDKDVYLKSEVLALVQAVGW